MAKKEKSAEDRVITLLTKIKGVFKNDCYIIDGIKVIPGSKTDSELPGLMYVDLDPEYITAVKEVFGNHKEIYIDDVTEAKLEWEKHVTYIDDGADENQQVSEYIAKVDAAFGKLDEWKLFRNMPHTDILQFMVDSVFNNQSIYRFEPQRSGGVVLTKQMFPTITLNSIDDTEYAFGKYGDDITLLFLRYNNSIGKVYIVYGYLNDGTESSTNPGEIAFKNKIADEIIKEF